MKKRNRVSHFILLGAMSVSSVVANASSTTGSAAAISPVAINFLSTAGTIAKEGIALCFAVLKGIVGMFSVPIFLFILFRVVYYNYFVLEGGTVPDVVSSGFTLPFKGISYVCSGVTSLFKGNSSKCESKDLALNDESRPKLISISELGGEVKTLKNKLFQLKDKEVDSLKGKIKELKSRIYATRGVFSDRNVRCLASWSNSFWYYFTTLFFQPTRQKYNGLEKDLKDMESAISDVSDLLESISNLQNEKIEEMTLNELLTGDIVGRVENISERSEILRNKVSEIYATLKRELSYAYINLIEKKIKDLIYREQSKIDDIVKALSDNIKKFETLFSEKEFEELKDFPEQLKRLKNIIEFNKKMGTVFEQIRGKFDKAQLKKELDTIICKLNPSILESFLHTCSNNIFIGQLTADQEKLLIDIYRNYSSLEKCYKQCSKITKKDNIFGFKGSLLEFNKNLCILEMIFKDERNYTALVKAGHTLDCVNKQMSKADETFKGGIEIPSSATSFFDYCRGIKFRIECAIDILLLSKKSVVTKDRVLGKMVSNKLDPVMLVYEKRCKESENILSKVILWYNKINSDIPYVEKGTFKEEAARICNSECLEKEFEKLDVLYRDGISRRFAELKKKMVLSIEKKLEEKFEAVGLTELKREYLELLSEVKTFLSTPNVSDRIVDLSDRFSKTVKNINTFVSSHKIDRKSEGIYSEGFMCAICKVLEFYKYLRMYFTEACTKRKLGIFFDNFPKLMDYLYSNNTYNLLKGTVYLNSCYKFIVSLVNHFVEKYSDLVKDEYLLAIKEKLPVEFIKKIPTKESLEKRGYDYGRFFEKVRCFGSKWVDGIGSFNSSLSGLN